MPYFTWRGVALDGSLRSGTVYAQSQSELDALLLKRDIALMHSVQIKKRWMPRSISSTILHDFFRQVALLLEAGVLLPEALIIVQRQSNHYYFQEVIHAISEQIHAGASLSQGLQKYPHLFSQLMVQMVYVGQESGQLAIVLGLLAQYLDIADSFKKQIRAAALMPLISVVFFIVISSVIVFGIMPQFLTLSEQFNQELPLLTRWFIAANTKIYSMAMMPFIMGICIVVFCVRSYVSLPHGRRVRDNVMFSIPGVKTLIMQSSMVYFLNTMALLLVSGMQLPAALRIAKKSITNLIVQDHIDYLIEHVEAGTSLSAAMAQHPHQFFPYDIIVVVEVGQESGQLHHLLERSAAQYQERVKRSLRIITTVLQPLLLIILGLLTALLIFAVYLPVLQFSYSVH